MENNELAEQLKKRLHEGEVNFTYRKKNGEERSARGTLNSSVYGEQNTPAGKEISFPDNQIRYFDLNSNGWRSFLVENLISIED